MNEWTVEQVAACIDVLKCARTQAEWLGVAERTAAMFQRTDKDVIFRKLWAVMLRADVYDFSGITRPLAEERTYGLDRLVGMSRRTHSREILQRREGAAPDAGYLADVLRADIRVIEESMKETDPNAGIQGFGL